MVEAQGFNNLDGFAILLLHQRKVGMKHLIAQLPCPKGAANCRPCSNSRRMFF